MVRAWVCGGVRVENVWNVLHSHNRRLLLQTVVKLKTYTLWHAVETFFSWILLVLERVAYMFVCMSSCTVCKCNPVAWALDPYILLQVCVSAYTSDRCCCGTMCTNTCWAAFNCSPKSRCVLNYRGLWLVVYWGWSEAVEVSVSILHKQGRISDIPHC